MSNHLFLTRKDFVKFSMEDFRSTLPEFIKNIRDETRANNYAAITADDVIFMIENLEDYLELVDKSQTT